MSAAAPLSTEMMTETRSRLAEYGLKDYSMRQAWGMTEISPLGTLVRLDEGLTCTEAHVGAPIPFTDVKIVDIESGDVVRQDVEGELCVKGPQVMKGYFKNEEATRHTIDSDGWLRTGNV